MTESAANGLLRINFSLRGFAKTVSAKSMSAFTPDPVALQTFSRYLASLNLKPDDPLTFASLPEFRGLDYVGYIIEKERLDPSNGTWIRLEEYRIIGQQACSYKDTRVAYGCTYRYRLRTVCKFTAYDPQVVDFSIYQQDLTTLLKQTLAQGAAKNGTLIQRLAPSGLQSKADSNKQSSVSLSDNVSISVNAQGVPQFNYAISSAQTQALSSQAVNSLQALQTALASSTPISNAQLQTYINGLQNYKPQQTGTKQYLSEYLVSYPSRNWQYAVIRNDDLPPWPEAIQVQPSSPNGAISVYWLSPPDSQRDVSSFNVYRRNAVGDPWALVAPNVPLDVNAYVDTNVQVGQKYIYAVQTNNLHGYSSFLSTQVQAELNKSFKFDQVEKPLKWISGPGARPDESDTIFAAFYESNEQLIAYKNVAISPSKTFNDTDATVIVKVRSLDTQEKKEFVVNLHNKSHA